MQRLQLGEEDLVRPTHCPWPVLSLYLLLYAPPVLPEVMNCLGTVLDLANPTPPESCSQQCGKRFPPQFKLPRTIASATPGSGSLANIPLLLSSCQFLVAQQVVIDECEDFLRGDRFHVAFPVNTLLVN